MNDLSSPRYRTVEMYLFDTCTHKCAYCSLAENGSVLDNSQLNPYRDEAFTDKIANFFNKRTSDDQKWLFLLTGGEPLLLPNFQAFAEKICATGSKIAVYSAILVGENNAAYQFLLNGGAAITDYLMISFHPEAEEIEERHFSRLIALKKAGHKVIFRLVGHPSRLSRLDELAGKCRDLDIAFYPTPLFSPKYPASYTDEQRRRLLSHASSLSQVIQLESGLDTTGLQCLAGSEMIAVYIKTGNITPCVSVSHPILGNIYEDTFTPAQGSIDCPQQGISCACDVTFQQGIIKAADDRVAFSMQKNGYVAPTAPETLLRSLTSNGLNFAKMPPAIGQTKTADFRSLDTKTVKAAFQENKDYYWGKYTEVNHSEFLSRQFPNRPAASATSMRTRSVEVNEPVARPSIWSKIRAPFSRG